MSQQFHYRVYPATVERSEVLPDSSAIILTEEQQKAASGWGKPAVFIGLLVGALMTAAFFLLLIYVGLINGRTLDDERTPIYIGLLIFSVIGVTLVARLINKQNIAGVKREIQKRRDEDYLARKRSNEAKYKENVETSEREAQRLTSELSNVIKSSLEATAKLPQWLANSANELTRADYEYREHAYSPFWDAIEQVAKNLASFNQTTQAVTANASRYYSVLKDRQHTFPRFPIRIETFPDPMPVTKEFRRLVRLGQTNFEFANIWEHRRTRDVLIAGFQSLGDAVNRLGVTIEDSMRSLQDVTASHLGYMVDEQMEARFILAAEAKEQTDIAKEQSRMLDNIQHRRKPSF